MNQNPKNNTEHQILSKTPEHTPQASFYIEALRIKYVDYSSVLDRLDIIASKLGKVSDDVRQTVTEMLKADLEHKVINTNILTAAIMAINPKNTIQVATNDERFTSAA